MDILLLFQQFFNPSAYRDYALFLSQAHLSVLLFFLLTLVWLYVYRNKPYMSKVRWILFGVLVFTEIALITWTITNGFWDIRYNLPLHLCTISLFLSAYMLLTKNYRIFEVLYFFGLGGAIQAMLTPDLTYTFPHFRFFHFFIAHIAIILAVLYMVWIFKYTVTIGSLIKSFIVLNGLALIAFSVNQLTGANYMFLARKPQGPSMLDWLGPYPWYILSLQLIVLVIFFLLYLPFRQKKTSS
ncbi:putative integral membrane protein (TIGR02206 family) [Evansella vedderi]|uniref:Integral membrane protein (TIGR02206 family) n=1 Tax=Evansella vedderi TaxID=38282 RepID=A0ABT9ZYA6_9BACI|nr:TIGR02206 family membrane protein [Evansella vedderi]MDQ0255100.1 putative integral membrane protein (TIGR02206 family) [Evansella vedderi]